jgi:hypothetical protein
MKRIVILTVILAASALAAVPALADKGKGMGNPSTTTLDACGYFVGTQTPTDTKTKGATTSEKGTWTGVDNNYGGGPVASLGPVDGSYSETVTDTGGGSFSGTEDFKSKAGAISQTFSFDGTTFTVSVTATKSLAFLTSDTNGACYSGPFPRP